MEVAVEVSAGPGPSWEVREDELGPLAVHAEHGIRLRYLDAGDRAVGLTDPELEVAHRLSELPSITVSELRPVTEHHVGPLWIAELPFTSRLARELGVELRSTAPDEDAAMLTINEAETLVDALGGRLPTEAEWESAVRGDGARSAFVWGDHLPDDAELDRWLRWHLDSPELAYNSRHLGGLFFGEWTADDFRPSHDASVAAEAGSRVIKGGGAQFWPWQDEEWVWCLSAMRMPSSDLFDDRRAAARLVMAAEST